MGGINLKFKTHEIEQYELNLCVGVCEGKKEKQSVICYPDKNVKNEF